MLDEHGMTSQEVEDFLYLRVDKEMSRLKFENENLKKLMSRFNNATFVIYLKMLEYPDRVWCTGDFLGTVPEATVFRVFGDLRRMKLIKRLSQKRIRHFTRGGPNFFQYKLNEVK